MEIHYASSKPLSSKAMDFVHFDVDSIRQVVSGRHGTVPRYWVADPDQYEQNGRPLRDSTTPRLLAYSPEDQMLYANDGCNSCTHAVSRNLRNMDPAALKAFGTENQIPEPLLLRLAQVVASRD